MTRAVSLLLAVALALPAFAGCGGGGGGGSAPTPTPPGGGGTSPSTNPCAAVSDEAPAFTTGGARPDKGGLVGDAGWSWLDAAWVSRATAARRGGEGPIVRPADRDIGEVAVLEDRGVLIVEANSVDLANRGLRYRPNATGGYDVAAADSTFRSPLGSRLSLADDDAVSVSLAFGFPLFGAAESSAFVNTDGNVTFRQSDTASSARNVTRFLQGPPRVGLFFADLNPESGGSIWASSASDALTITWCAVPDFDGTGKVTAQATLLPDGTVEMRFAEVTLKDGIVGLSPGATAEFVAADLSGGGQSSGRQAIAERFSSTADLDLEAAARRFYVSHADDYDQIVFWTDQRVVSSGTFAFEITAQNAIRGLGISRFDQSGSFGSAGRLSSVVVMDTITKYPDDPERTVLGENSTLSVLAHETGHRWLMFLRFLDHNRESSTALLGRDEAHWSFFADSDGSVLEGNDIDDLGGGKFTTVGAVNKYSRTDLYAMGLAAESEVPPLFYVENPVNASPGSPEPGSAPRIGVSFDGTRREVRLQDIIDVMGRRDPPASASPRLWRQAHVFVIGGGRAVDAALVERIERIRRGFEPFYQRATEDRGRVETRLRP
jgi:hypothetical protein